MCNDVTIADVNFQMLAEGLGPFIGEITAFKPLNTRFVATGWDNIPQPPADYYFTDIQAAIDSVTDQSPTNQYLILLFPGIYAGTAFLSQEKRERMHRQVHRAMAKAKRLLLKNARNGGKMDRSAFKKGDIFDFSEFRTEATTNIVLKPNVSLCGFGLPSATVISANITLSPTSPGDIMSLSNIFFTDGDFTYTNLAPLPNTVIIFSECAFLEGSITVNSNQQDDYFNFIGGFLGFGDVNFGPTGNYNIDYSNVLFLGSCNFTGDVGLALSPLVQFHSPAAFILDGMVLSQGARMLLQGSFLQAFGAGIQVNTNSDVYASFSHINASAFNVSGNSRIFASNTPMLIYPTLDVTSGLDRTISTAKMTAVPAGLSQLVTFASLGLPNYITNSYQVTLNFQLTPAEVGLFVLPVFVQVDDGSTTTTGFTLSTNAVIFAITFTFIQPNITMQ